MIPKWIVIQLLEKCNLRCKMCYQWGQTGSYIEKEKLVSIDFTKIIEIVEQCKTWKPFYGLFGGEPLMYKQIWKTIDIMKRAGSVVYMDTNGILIEPNVKRIIESGIDRLWISLDGTEEINDIQRSKNVYRRVVSGIEKLFEERAIQQTRFPEIGVTYIVTPLNHQYIEELFCNILDISKLDYISIEFQNFMTHADFIEYNKILSENFNITSVLSAQSIVRDLSDFSNIDFKIISEQIINLRKKGDKLGIKVLTAPVNTEPENVEHYFKSEWSKLKNRKESCQLPWIYAEITASGNVSTCHTFYDYLLGNVNETELISLFNNSSATNIRKLLKKKKLLPICFACSRYHTDMNIRFQS